MQPDLYAILGLTKEASSAEIRAAYRKLAMQYHPDSNPDPAAHEKFVAINKAHSILSDPVRKSFYDLSRSTRYQVQRFREQVSRKPPGSDFWETPAGRKRREELIQERKTLDKLVTFFKRLAFFWWAICIAFSVDHFFPASDGMHVLQEGWEGGRTPMKTDRTEFMLDLYYFSCVVPGQPVELYKGRVFPVIQRIRFTSPCHQESGTRFDVQRSVFGGGYILVLFVGLLSTLPWFVKKKEYAVFAGIFGSVFGLSLLFSLLMYIPF
ncbi:MAG: J domain-containing protein [Bacteroidota bacterium]